MGPTTRAEAAGRRGSDDMDDTSRRATSSCSDHDDYDNGGMAVLPRDANGELNDAVEDEGGGGAWQSGAGAVSVCPALTSIAVRDSEGVNLHIGPRTTSFQGPVTVLKQVLVTVSPPAGNASLENTLRALAASEVDSSGAEKLFAAPALGGSGGVWDSLLLRLKRCAYQGVILGILASLALMVSVPLIVWTSPNNLPDSPPHNNSSIDSDDEKGEVGNQSLIVSRRQWGALPSKEKMDRLRTPVEYIIIIHSASSSCFTLEDCSLKVRNIQAYHHRNSDMLDIGYGFLVGGDGRAYEGRGWDNVGAHTYGWNSRSLGICFIGNFMATRAPQAQQQAALNLIELGLRLGKVHSDYKIVSQKDLKATESPGIELIEDMKSWPHRYDTKSGSYYTTSATTNSPPVAVT